LVGQRASRGHAQEAPAPHASVTSGRDTEFGTEGGFSVPVTHMRWALWTSSRLELTPSFAYEFARCVSTVRSPMKRRAPIWRAVNPAAASSTTSFSRAGGGWSGAESATPTRRARCEAVEGSMGGATSERSMGEPSPERRAARTSTVMAMHAAHVDAADWGETLPTTAPSTAIATANSTSGRYASSVYHAATATGTTASDATEMSRGVDSSPKKMTTTVRKAAPPMTCAVAAPIPPPLLVNRAVFCIREL